MLTDCHTHTPRENAIASGSPRKVEQWIAENAPGAFSVGVHPWDTSIIMADESVAATNALELDVAMQGVWDVARNPRVVAIGEAGIDALRGASIEVQREVMRKHVEISEMLCKPLVLHIVKGVEVVMALRRELGARQPWIWHGFRGKREQAAQWLAFDPNFYISLGENFNVLAARILPFDRTLFETDDSTLSISDIAARYASVRELPPAEALKIGAGNLQGLLRGAPDACR